jgi:predicted phage terminase large subunit-like protein
MEFLTIFVNEASQITYEAFTTLLTRLAQKIENAKNLLFVDENPPSKKHWSYKVFVEKIEPEGNLPINQAEKYAYIKMNPADNLENISEEYMDLLASLPERKKRRFLRGEFGDDNEGALWTEEMIAYGRVIKCPELKRIVVSIDPAVTSKDTSDETGIIVAGEGHDGHLYVLEDATDTYTPTEWAQKGVDLFYKWKADRIVGEVNNGGDLIETVIRTIDKTIPYKGVHATRDKLTRAEPVSSLYEHNDVKPNMAHHVGEFPELELEMTSWEAQKGEKSPNRIDALVWSAYELNLVGSIDYSFGW